MPFTDLQDRFGHFVLLMFLSVVWNSSYEPLLSSSLDSNYLTEKISNFWPLSEISKEFLQEISVIGVNRL